MKYIDVLLKYFRIAAVVALASTAFILGSAGNAAKAAVPSSAAQILPALAAPTQDARVDKAYYYRWHRWHRRHYWHRRHFWYRRHYWYRPHYYWRPWRRHYWYW